MTLPNRVAPDGTLHAVAARGNFIGNRGVIHDPVTKNGNGKRWTTKSWIVCTCQWQNRRRDVWGYQNGPGRAGWSELFFLDEVTALSAGHRPCFYCRRQDANAFRAAFGAGNDISMPRAPQMDRLLHAERRLSSLNTAPDTRIDELADLPDGTIVEVSGQFYAIRYQSALAWNFAGYKPATDFSEIFEKPGEHAVSIVTPNSTIAALKNGFKPVWHESAGS